MLPVYLTLLAVNTRLHLIITAKQPTVQISCCISDFHLFSKVTLVKVWSVVHIGADFMRFKWKVRGISN